MNSESVSVPFLSRNMVIALINPIIRRIGVYDWSRWKSRGYWLTVSMFKILEFADFGLQGMGRYGVGRGINIQAPCEAPSIR
jgi:hypothetical protein